MFPGAPVMTCYTGIVLVRGTWIPGQAGYKIINGNSFN